MASPSATLASSLSTARERAGVTAERVAAQLSAGAGRALGRVGEVRQLLAGHAEALKSRAAEEVADMLALKTLGTDSASMNYQQRLRAQYGDMVGGVAGGGGGGGARPRAGSAAAAAAAAPGSSSSSSSSSRSSSSSSSSRGGGGAPQLAAAAAAPLGAAAPAASGLRGAGEEEAAGQAEEAGGAGAWGGGSGSVQTPFGHSSLPPGGLAPVASSLRAGTASVSSGQGSGGAGLLSYYVERGAGAIKGQDGAEVVVPLVVPQAAKWTA
jgi:hypothetical protein